MKLQNILKTYKPNSYDSAMTDTYSSLIDRKEFFSRLSLSPKDKVLEVCCGTGLNFKYISQDTEIYGIDINKKMLKRASKRRKTKKLICGNAEYLPFPNDFFDAGFETLGFCVTPDPEKALAELLRVIKRGGKIALFDMCRSSDNKMALAQELMKPYCSSVGHPKNKIIWDPTIDFEKILASLPVKIIQKQVLEPISPWSRILAVCEKI